MNNVASVPLCILEEIGLEGLEGITIEGLWKRLSVRLKLPLPLKDRLTNNVWQFVRNAKCLQFYELPEEREPLKLFDRADCTDPIFGNVEAETCPYNSYKYNPISTQDVRGSCEHFKTRKEISKDDLADYTENEIELNYGRRFVIVASQSLRNALLIPPTVSKDVELNISCYCILERLGRARYNGELTHGKYSLADVGGDPVLFHNHKKKLQRNKLIECQSFHQTIEGTNTSGQLVHLPRYFALFKPRHIMLMEKIIGILKSKPNCMAEYQEVKGEFEESLQRTLTRLFKSSFFHKFVLTDTKVPYRAIYPNATEKEWKLPKRDSERSLNVLQLRDANIEPSQLWNKCESIGDDPVDEEEEGEGFLDESNAIRDLPLLHQLYKYIEASKERGISELEARLHLGQSKLNGRALIKNLVKDKIIEFFTTSHKRQTIRRYVLPKFNKPNNLSTNEVIDNATIESETFFTDTDDATVVMEIEPSVKSEETESIVAEETEGTEISEIILDQIAVNDAFRVERDEHENRIESDIVVTITEINDTDYKLPRRRMIIKDANITDKTKERIRFIQKEVQSKVLFDDPAKLHSAIKHLEASRGLTDTMCRKTFYRLLSYMCQKRMLRLWRIEFQYRSKHRSLIYVSSTKVDDGFSLMQSCIDQAKSKFKLNIYEEECRIEGKKSKAASMSQSSQEKSESKIEQGQKLSALPNALNYGITPKFIRLRTLHEFLFYLSREHRSLKLSNQEEIVEQLKTSSPSAFSDVDEIPEIWNPEIGWQMFIPPLIKHNGFDKGWCLLSDCIFRMPLSIFVKVVNISYEIKGLDEYLAHPIKKHILVKNIPVNFQRMLFARRKYISSLTDLIQRMICIGLVQAGPHRALKDQAFYYINTFATIVDTSSSLPGTYYISEQEYTELVYSFNSLDDVSTYWNDMHRICMSTKLNLKPSNRDKTPADKILPQKFLPFLKAIQPRQAKDRDKGQLPGDGRGAAGLDSYFFAHLERNWAFNSTKYKPKVTLKPKSGVAAPTKYSRLVRMTRDVNLKKHESRVAPVPLHKLKSAAIRRRIPIVRKKKKTVKRKKVRNKYDDIDKMALQQMNKLRVDWNQQEDNFLLLCKVAQMYLNPSNRLLMPSQVIRDLIHWHCKSLNKTSYACRRRIAYITKKLPNSDQINNSILMCLNEIKENKSIEKRFGGNFIKTLKKVYPDEEDLHRAFKIHFIDLVHALSCQFYNLTNSFQSNTFILPRTLQEFKAKFYERNDSVYDSNTIRYDEPQTVDDIRIAAIVTLIHSTVCCSYDKTSWSIQLYEIYKDFPERLLSIAMRKVRSDQLISQNKMSNPHVVQNRCLPLSSSGFHLSATYQQQMTTKISYDIFDESYSIIKDIMRDVNERNEPHVFNLSHNAICFFVAELPQMKCYRTNIEIPKRVLLLDPTKRLPDESFEGVYDRFHEIFNYIPKIDLTGGDDSTLDDLISELPSEEKSPATNETSNIIKKLDNLPSDILHIFCIVDSFGTSKPRNQLAMTEDGKCPYDCLKQLEKPFENLMDKLVAKREVWYRLNSEQFEFDPLPDVATIDENNIMAIYNCLVLNGANVTDEQRNANLELFKQVSDIVDELLLENDKDFIDEEDFGAECDLRNDVKKQLYDGAQINDKIHKFHDFLCVNTCKLSLVPIGNTSDSNEIINLHELNKKRDDILAKIVQDANWSPELRSNTDFVSLLKEKGLDMNEIHIAVDVFNYIDQQGEMGAKAGSLTERYEDKEFLQKILDYFNTAKLVMKTGVCEVTYVHWKHIKPWVVNTYNLKRIEREEVTPSPKSLLQVSDTANTLNAPATSSGTKRKSSDEEIPAKIKRTKSAIDDSSTIEESPKSATLERSIDLENDTETNKSGTESSSDISQTKSSAKSSERLINSIIEHGAELDPTTMPQHKKTFPLKMAPWTRVNGSVNRRVLDKYAGTILLHCIENFGLTLFTLCTRFHYLLPIHVYEIVQYLEEFGCLQITAISKPKPVTLFSKYESVSIGPATDLDDFRNITIEPTIDAVTKVSVFIGEKKYKEDFI